ncbi:dimethyl sulfoxide reductase anchor subunit [Gammaproteobacteria bacterium]|nr:dimethyl sulfoxide reductase anchor subunit [Gammaproteobacteria bacterium]
MFPALSVILFTTLSGLGFGLLFWVGLLAPHSLLSLGIGAVLAVVGLGCSTLHLKRPSRARFAFSQWRSSWLSREGVMAVVTLALCLLTMLWPTAFGGILLAIAAAITVYTTGMIYGQLRAVQMWFTALTPAVYLGFAAASGFLAYSAVGSLVGVSAAQSVVAALLLIALAWLLKALWWRRADDPNVEISSPSTATGLKGPVRQLEAPHTGANYLSNEFGYRVGRRHRQTLRRVAWIAGAALPLVLLVLAWLLTTAAPLLLVMALIFLLIGLFAERWLFFAEARHAVMNFYQ